MNTVVNLTALGMRVRVCPLQRAGGSGEAREVNTVVNLTALGMRGRVRPLPLPAGVWGGPESELGREFKGPPNAMTCVHLPAREGGRAMK